MSPRFPAWKTVDDKVKQWEITTEHKHEREI